MEYSQTLDTALLVKRILKTHTQHEWSLQGFGMLRLYLAEDLRLHVWNSKFRVSGVSDIHDHPWDFSSRVVCGRVINRRFEEANVGNYGRWYPGPETHIKTKIICGDDARLQEPGMLYQGPYPVRLVEGPEELYLPGQTYGQAAKEFHRSEMVDGTVTLCRRYFHSDFERDTAFVYVPIGSEWVSAKPRPATQDEVFEFIQPALALLQAMLTGLKPTSPVRPKT